MFWGAIINPSSSHSVLVRFDKKWTKDGIKTSMLANAACVSECDRDSIAKNVSICSFIALNCPEINQVLNVGFILRQTSWEDLSASYKNVHNRSMRTNLSESACLLPSFRETVETLTNTQERDGSMAYRPARLDWMTDESLQEPKRISSLQVRVKVLSLWPVRRRAAQTWASATRGTNLPKLVTARRGFGILLLCDGGLLATEAERFQQTKHVV